MAEENRTLTIVPPEAIPQPPYANQTYVIVLNQIDVNVIFMRIPLLSDDHARSIIESGKAQIEGDVVGSITLPRTVARDFATQILKTLSDADKAAGR